MAWWGRGAGRPPLHAVGQQTRRLADPLYLFSSVVTGVIVFYFAFQIVST